MGREKLVKLSDEELEKLLEAKKLVKLYGISTFSKKAQATLKNNALGDYVYLGSQLIIEHIKEHFTVGES
ncbi:MAG: hypothetical protein ABIH76_02865 [Candidatus Bathyarchaeota archaeon]